MGALTVGDLFSGIGGMSLGLRMAGGFETRWFCEVDPYCQRILNKHWPGVPIYDDVRELRGCCVEPVDVLAGGFPCQPISAAGQRMGTADDRWLWPEFARLIREIRPRWVLAENVPTLRSDDNGRTFGTVLSDLAACGYDAEWDCIPAAALGAHHLRDRVWIVAYPNGSGCDGRAGEQWPGGRSESADADSDQRAVTDANGQRFLRPNDALRTGRNAAERGGPGALADGHGGRQLQPRRRECELRRRTGDGVAATVSDADREPLVRFAESWPEYVPWSPEPDVARMVHGIPRGLDRRRALGNAVVPQVVELIGRRIVAAHEQAVS